MRRSLQARSNGEYEVIAEATLAGDFPDQCKSLASREPAAVLVHLHALRADTVRGRSGVDDPDAEQELLHGLRILHDNSRETRIAIYSQIFTPLTVAARRERIHKGAFELYRNNDANRKAYDGLAAAIEPLPWSASQKPRPAEIDDLVEFVKQATTRVKQAGTP